MDKKKRIGRFVKLTFILFGCISLFKLNHDILSDIIYKANKRKKED